MTERPNILLVVPDQHRPEWVGFNPDVPVETPVLDRLADRGIAFENAVCPSPICGPSRACLASGMEYDRCGVRDMFDADYPLSARTLYGRLRDEADYHAMGTGKFDLQKYSNMNAPFMGLDGTKTVHANGFSEGVDSLGKWDAVRSGSEEPQDPYMRYLHDRGLAETHVEDFERRGGEHQPTFPTSLPEEAYCDNWIGRRSADLLRGAPADQPWFLQVNFAGPHSPWDVTETMHDWYRDPDVGFPDPVEPGDQLDPAQHQEVRRNYAAMIENIDRWLGRFLDIVEERGESGNTLVVFTSDHGEQLGDHGRWGKQDPYQSSVGVPLVVAGPGVTPRGTVGVPATILDLHATFLDLAGVDPGPIDSRSMRSYFAGGESPRDVVFSGLGHWRLAFDGRYKLIRGYDATAGTSVSSEDGDDACMEGALEQSLRERDPLLFDLADDPGETKNISDERPDACERLRSALSEMRK
jgi:choline-sulfatase